MNKFKKTCLITVPVYNEEDVLEDLINQLLSVSLDNDKYSFSLIFINDGSTDNSEEILKSKGLNYITNPVNLGIGGGIQCGYKYATENDFDYFIQVDGDGQHPPEEIPKLLHAAESNTEDWIIGSRFIINSDYKPSFFRKMGMKYSTMMLYFTTGVTIKDTTSGFRLAKKKLIRYLAKDYPQHEDGLVSLFITSKAGFTLKEIPIRMVERKYGKSGIGFIRSLFYPYKIIINSLAAVLRRPL
jgi:glycosyltransferase involved in cell wall biosynthesis